MAKRKYSPIDVNRAKELFYLSRTSPSGLRHKKARQGVKVDKEAGSKKKNGYWNVMMDGKLYKVHRIVYAIYHNRDPGNFIVDHIDFNPSNNNPENLRLLNDSQSQKHRRPYGKSRFKGVYWNKQKKKWEVHIRVNGKIIYLGRYEIEEEAGLVFFLAEELREAGLPIDREEIKKQLNNENMARFRRFLALF
jgi:hypothetical protein